MKRHSLSGSIQMHGEVYQTVFSTYMHKSGYLYARSEAQKGLQQIQIYLHPFPQALVVQYPAVLDVDRKFDFSGDDLGFVRLGSDNAEGVWSVWKLRLVRMCLRWRASGLILEFEVDTGRGSWTEKGAVEPAGEGRLDPISYAFKMLVPAKELKDFLRGQQYSELDTDRGVDQFLDSLVRAGLQSD